MSTDDVQDFIIDSFDAVSDLALFDGVLFADEFDEVADAVPQIDVATRRLTDDDVSQARAQGYAEGLGDAARDADQAAQRACAAALDALRNALAESRTAALQITQQTAAVLAATILRALATMLPELCAGHGDAEARLLIKTLLPMLAQEPKATIHASTRTLSALQELSVVIDAVQGGRLRLLPADPLLAGDLRIEWQDGSFARDAEGLLPTLQTMLETKTWPLATPAAAEPHRHYDKELADA